ncbi:MAG: proline dehydrogenase family protein [Bacteroidota bacterium]
MNDIGKPVYHSNQKLIEVIKSSNIRKFKPAISDIDFSNTEIAFAHKSDKALKKTAFLFRVMNKPFLVNVGSKLGVWAVKWRLPFVKKIVENTIFQQFCGGTTLARSKPTIDELQQSNVLSVLDYGAEAKDSEADFNLIMNEIIRGIEFAANNESVPVVVCKLSGMASNDLLEKVSLGTKLNAKEQSAWQGVRNRVETICNVAAENSVAIFFDAEESWIQAAIDGLVEEMMERHNKEQALIYGTFQMYRKDRLQFLKDAYDKAQAGAYILGAKLVRGAYMKKEGERAYEMGYESPIQPSKAATDRDFNAAVRFCVERYQGIASCNASHNQESCKLQADLIEQLGLPKNHSHLNFCQLMGMSDHLTFNLAQSGFNVAKYVVYGPVREVLPYLVRRAEENTSVTGDMSRELSFIETEMDRRDL